MIFLLMLFSICVKTQSQTKKIHTLKFSNVDDTKDYFHYTGNDVPIISAHRGGAIENYPENTIATFEYTLSCTPAIFEIDARMAKDNEVVLMHDETLERTSTGKGKLKDLTLEEVRKLKLKDPTGRISEYSIPTLAEAIEWSEGKTLINLDVKDVPLKTKAEMVKKYNAFHHVIFTVHNAEQAKFFYDFDNRSLFSAFVKSKKKFMTYENAGIPWENVLFAYVGSKSTDSNKELYDLLHQNGVMVMVSAAPGYDKLGTPEERAEAYKKILRDGADVIETDRPEEVASAIKSLCPKESSKCKYWNTKNLN